MRRISLSGKGKVKLRMKAAHEAKVRKMQAEYEILWNAYQGVSSTPDGARWRASDGA